MEWVWTEQKAARNFRDHGILFETAALVFHDENRLTLPDPHPDDDRWRTIGMVGMTTLFVVHTMIEDDGNARIISARRATPRERRSYDTSRI